MSINKKSMMFFAACIAATVAAYLCGSQIGMSIGIGASMGCVNQFLIKKQKAKK